MKVFKWQHIQFADGSNPYICKTEKDFKWMGRTTFIKNTHLEDTIHQIRITKNKNIAVIKATGFR